jgi:triacylglycerol lipase
MPTPEGVYTQSVGTVLKKATSGKFPLNFSYHLVKYFSGENDGLVSEDSFSFGEKYILLRPQGKRGISHGDIIDLNRENIENFDVREFYVNIVNELKTKGL